MFSSYQIYYSHAYNMDISEILKISMKKIYILKVV